MVYYRLGEKYFIMKPLNYAERKRQIFAFCIYFTMLLVFLFTCSFLTLVTAKKGIVLLENKKDKYDKVFKKQADISFQLEGIYKKLHNLKNKDRNLGEHKQMQLLITEERKLIEQDIDTTDVENKHYKLYFEFLTQIEGFQIIMDSYQKEKEKRRHNMEQLEKCKEKYKELSKRKIK